MDIQGLGRVESAQELGRQARWVGCRPTPDPRRGGWVEGVDPATPRGVPDEWLRQAEPQGVWRPALGKVFKSGGECPG